MHANNRYFQKFQINSKQIQKNINLLDKNEIYELSKNITNELKKRINNIVISSPNWHTICIAHLACCIIFNESSSACLGTYLAHYVDITLNLIIFY